MDYPSRWPIIKLKGQGGQGQVFHVYDASKVMGRQELISVVESFIQQLSGPGKTVEGVRLGAFESFRNAVVDVIRMDDPAYQGALKVLHQPEEARNADSANDRIKLEIQAMSDIVHPNLLKILDADTDSKWFVSQYHPNGTLVENQRQFAGNFAKALRAFRPLVEGVSELHKQDRVHRDIKPHNVFFDTANNLILGDFGLVFFTDTHHTRLSDTLENVGSTDWMPPWATRMRIEDVKPSFDVFSLGKLLWFMVSGLPILRLWYFDHPEFDVEVKFPRSPFIQFANTLFKKCIVERERDCLPNASELLTEIDQILSMVDSDIDRFDLESKRQCKVCGVGYYELLDINATRNLGVNPYSDEALKVFTCNDCGNVQLFTQRLA
jgi:serine/threonine protein kinase